MNLIEITHRTPALVQQLLTVWEASVRATHLFLTEPEIQRIKAYVPQALNSVEHLITAGNGDGTLIAFMGIENGTLEMLFVAPEERGKGVGKKLVLYGMECYAIRKLAVNEQNPQARGFYERMGFRVCRRTETDEQGGPYPLLYMRRE